MQRLHYTPGGLRVFSLSSSYISKAGNKTSLKIGSYKSTCTISLLAAFPRCRLEDGGTKWTTKQQQNRQIAHNTYTTAVSAGEAGALAGLAKQHNKCKM